jgi:hypothetical protein
MTGESVGAPYGLDPVINGWSRADGIDVLGTRLTYAEARRLGRVLGALAAAGLIDECHVFVCAAEDGSAGRANR